MLSSSELADSLRQKGTELGFSVVGIAPAVSPAGVSRLYDWLEQGYAGEMQYLPRRAAAYQHPDHVLAGVRSVVMVAMNYKPPPANESNPAGIPARVAAYARGRTDYHDLMRERLQSMGDELHRLVPGCRTRCVVDTAPLLEREFARLAGLGWFGKNTMLIHKRLGSFQFLGALLTDAELEPDQPHETSHCGTCTRCLDVCPTAAFPAPGVLDARRCLSYLTIELKGPIPEDLRTGIGDWLFGCDLCQDVCPWNRKSPVATEPEFLPQPWLAPADALEILTAPDETLISRFRGTPQERTGPLRLKRNAAIVAGNSGQARALPALEHALQHESELVREAAAWAIRQIGKSRQAAAPETGDPAS
jgi:epoxyqueuosine reductase